MITIEERRKQIRNAVKKHYEQYPEKNGWAQINKRLKKQGYEPISMAIYERWLAFRTKYEELYNKKYQGRGKGFLKWLDKKDKLKSQI